MENIFFLNPELNIPFSFDLCINCYEYEDNLNNLFPDELKDTQIYKYIQQLRKELNDLRLKLIDVSSAYSKYLENVATTGHLSVLEKKLKDFQFQIEEYSRQIRDKVGLLNKSVIFAWYLSHADPEPVLEFLIKAQESNLLKIQIYLSNLEGEK